MVSHQNDLSVFVTRPVSAVVLLLALLLVAWPSVRSLRSRLRAGVQG